jgi:hypothetical protein
VSSDDDGSLEGESDNSLVESIDLEPSTDPNNSFHGSVDLLSHVPKSTNEPVNPDLINSEPNPV